MRQHHDELMDEMENKFSSLREEVLLAISELQVGSLPPFNSSVRKQKKVMVERENKASSGSSQLEIQPGTFATDMAKKESRKETTQGISEVNASAFPLEVDLTRTNETPDVPQRQPSNESTFSILNIYDPADRIRDDDDEQNLSMSKSLAQMTHKSVRAWKSRIDGQGFDLFMGV